MKTTVLTLVLPVNLLVLSGCNKKDEEASKSFGAGKTALFDAVRETSPKITASDSLGLNWGSGGTTYEIFNLIRDYNNDTDNGKVDGSNMYKALYEASSYMAGAYQQCIPSSEKSVISPFDFGSETLSQTFDCGYEGTQSNTMGDYTMSFVVKREPDFDYEVGPKETPEEYSARFATTQKSFLLGWGVVSQSSANVRAVYQGKIDPKTKDVVLNSSYLVDYTGGTMAGSNYSVRLHLTGNMDTHLFTMRLAKSHVSIAAHGYAKGAGKYYLFRYQSIGQSDNGTTKYFCLASDTTEAQMKALDEKGFATVPDDCADLASGLPTSNYDTADQASNASDFKGKGALNIGLEYP